MTRHADDEAFAVDAVLCRSQVVSAVGGVRRGLGRDATSGLVLRVDPDREPGRCGRPKAKRNLFLDLQAVAGDLHFDNLWPEAWSG
jgi:hypothetical protein